MDDSEDTQSISVPIPLDSGGFLRRECPECERQFKVIISDDAEPVPEDGYYCPYCRRRVDPDHLHTPAQVEHIQAKGVNEILGPKVEEMSKRFDRRDSFISMSLDWTPAEETPLEEPDDMERRDPSCHPNEPIKVMDGWTRPVYCIICGNELS